MVLHWSLLVGRRFVVSYFMDEWNLKRISVGTEVVQSSCVKPLIIHTRGRYNALLECITCHSLAWSILWVREQHYFFEGKVFHSLVIYSVQWWCKRKNVEPHERIVTDFSLIAMKNYFPWFKITWKAKGFVSYFKKK